MCLTNYFRLSYVTKRGEVETTETTTFCTLGTKFLNVDGKAFVQPLYKIYVMFDNITFLNVKMIFTVSFLATLKVSFVRRMHALC